MKIVLKISNYFITTEAKKEIHQTEKCKEFGYIALSPYFLEKHIYSKHPKDIWEECGTTFEDQSAVD